MKHFSIALALAAAVVLPLAGAQAQLVVGGPGVYGDCAPFGCTLRYQQAYSSSLFSGPINIGSLTFYDVSDSGQTIDAATYTLRLSTAATGVGSLSSTFADNIGGDAQLFFTGALSGPTAPSFTITGAAFLYEPGQGDLLLDVTKSGGDSFSAFIDYRSDFAGFQRVYAFDNAPTGAIDNNYGLVTGFGTAAVPEASTWTMLIAGFCMVGGAMRRRVARLA